jgi:hypothetical protein
MTALGTIFKTDLRWIRNTVGMLPLGERWGRVGAIVLKFQGCRAELTDAIEQIAVGLVGQVGMKCAFASNALRFRVKSRQGHLVIFF